MYKVYVYQTFHTLKCLNIIIGRCVCYNRYPELILYEQETFLYLRIIMGRSNKIYIVCSETFKLKEFVGKLPYSHFMPDFASRDLLVLTINAFQIAAREKDRPRAFFS